jgi:hypothetical protein
LTHAQPGMQGSTPAVHGTTGRCPPPLPPPVALPPPPVALPPPPVALPPPPVALLPPVPDPALPPPLSSLPQPAAMPHTAKATPTQGMWLRIRSSTKTAPKAEVCRAGTLAATATGWKADRGQACRSQRRATTPPSRNAPSSPIGRSPNQGKTAGAQARSAEHLRAGAGRPRSEAHPPSASRTRRSASGAEGVGRGHRGHRQELRRRSRKGGALAPQVHDVRLPQRWHQSSTCRSSTSLSASPLANRRSSSPTRAPLPRFNHARSSVERGSGRTRSS